MSPSEADSSWHTRHARWSESASAAGSIGSESAWISRQVQAMASAWARGEGVSAEHLLANHPGLGDEAAIRLIYALADLIRFRHGIDLPSSEEARSLIKNIHAVWNERDLLLGSLAEPLDRRSEQVIRDDLLDLAIVSAELRLGLAPPAELDAARRDVEQLLDFAAATCGPSPRLDRLRRSAAQATPASTPSDGDDPAALSTLDHFDQGRAHLRAARFREAAVDFQRVLDYRPQDFWPNFYQGLCAYRLSQFHDALAAFRTCVALAPDSAECYFNRARVADALGRSAISHSFSSSRALQPRESRRSSGLRHRLPI